MVSVNQIEDNTKLADTIASHLSLKIADKQVEHRQKIGESLAAKAQDPSWQMLEQLKGSGASIRRSDGLLRLHIAKALDRWQIPHSIEQTVKKLPLDNHEKFVWQSYK